MGRVIRIRAVEQLLRKARGGLEEALHAAAPVLRNGSGELRSGRGGVRAAERKVYTGTIIVCAWIPMRICLMVIEGFQPLSSFRMLRHTVPLG